MSNSQKSGCQFPCQVGGCFHLVIKFIEDAHYNTIVRFHIFEGIPIAIFDLFGIPDFPPGSENFISEAGFVDLAQYPAGFGGHFFRI